MILHERNEFLELNGLFWESLTHEWFKDIVTTTYARNENANGIALPNLSAFVVRNKQTGEYDRVLMDSIKNEIIYDTKSLEDMGARIDLLKTLKK